MQESMIAPILQKISRSEIGDHKFTILIPTWNNLPYLKLCLESIRENSHFKHQIIIVVNEGIDGTLAWIKSNPDLDYVYAEKNIGICYGLNSCRSLIKTDYLIYVNDDMYLLPDWDLYLWNDIKNIGHHYFVLSATMIEPFFSRNPCVIVADYGNTIETFRKEELLKNFRQVEHFDWQGSTWPPILLHLDIWDLVGGLSAEFSPGMGSDPDLTKKLWDLGVRYYKGISASRVYHFGSKSTDKVKKNDGRKMFLFKWGVSSNTFMTKYIKTGKIFTGQIELPSISKKDRNMAKLKMFRFLFK